ncbi:hypothetical protein TVAG_376730 [Trichomonas vaginalis G3]|uniref:Uncharacterized protein n=1 Tax=Trichomonas vaginalis (strain ATCC PRA-98 / G3) TaxID=412133 RepID=A2FW18_TRIV3|nr:hypothetical protein TVAGG3_0623350 [Trichomonas vaginalis G3]EAX90889.1 hypothetical protein TVAG_376730 [Trichomonas vaginalis G3]KAI5504019.1 hypothetical protein TVAGG3_0623350 [Trichomonas vaginalis G3]|eukprot:XP_001303819.1 hypothetical protein [Trichomonas vaginalis G3]
MSVLTTPVKKKESEYCISSTAFKSPPTSIIKSTSRPNTPEWITNSEHYAPILSSPVPHSRMESIQQPSSRNNSNKSKLIKFLTNPLFTLVLIILALVIADYRPEFTILVFLAIILFMFSMKSFLL